jgi:copper chaperone CopZ
MRNISIEIGGMSCEHCVKRVKKALEGLAGIVSADVTVGKALVTFNEKVVTEAEINKAIDKAGYTIVKI